MALIEFYASYRLFFYSSYSFDVRIDVFVFDSCLSRSMNVSYPWVIRLPFEWALEMKGVSRVMLLMGYEVLSPAHLPQFPQRSGEILTFPFGHYFISSTGRIRIVMAEDTTRFFPLLLFFLLSGDGNLVGCVLHSCSFSFSTE